MFSSNKENVNLNIPGKSYDKTNIDLNIKNLEENLKSMNITGGCHMSTLMNMQTMGIPFQNLQGIETFSEGMQVYFRDAFNLARIFSLIMAIKLNIFNIIQCNVNNQNQCNQLMSIHDIKSKIDNSNITERHLMDLLNELESQGFLVSEGTLESQKFKNSDLAMNYFTSKTSNNVSRLYMNLNRYITSFNESNQNNFKFVKPVNHSEYNFNNEEEVGMVLDYYYNTCESSFERMMEMIDFSRFKSVVDIRGGYGILAMKLKNRFPNVCVVSYDNPSIEKFAMEKVNAMNMKNNINIISGNLTCDKLPESDCFIAPHIFMHFNNENLLKIMKSICDSLSSKGQLIILENLIDTEKKDSKTCSMSFMMGLQNCEGNARSFNEYVSMLMKCGFKSVDRMQMGSGMSDLLIAMK